MKNEFLNEVVQKTNSIEIKAVVEPVRAPFTNAGAVTLLIFFAIISLAGLWQVLKQIHRFVYPDENDRAKQFSFARLLIGLVAIAMGGSAIIAPIFQGVSLLQTILNF